MNKPLLPSGLFDYLPPKAQSESAIVGTLLSHFRSCGYQQVTPPLMEYEETIINQSDSELSRRSFRVMDPLTQKMMAVRADMTMQIARIAGHLMAADSRPLRLCYAGQTLRTTPDQMRSTRQFRQTGIELFGCQELAADVEVIQTAVSAVQALGLTDLSVDLNLAGMLETLSTHLTPEQKTELSDAVRRKDISAMTQFDVPAVEDLVNATGEACAVLARLRSNDRLKSVVQQLDQLECAVNLLNERFGKSLALTIDPLEMRGFGYYTGLSFSVYLTSASVEIGRGGRYQTEHGETATGFTLYSEDLVPMIAAPEQPLRLMVTLETTQERVAHWQAEGYTVIYATTNESANEARAMGCTHRILNGTIINVN